MLTCLDLYIFVLNVTSNDVKNKLCPNMMMLYWLIICCTMLVISVGKLV